MSRPGTLHATCLLLGETGILIQGSSGSGKSLLARQILALAALAGRFARLVADDRVAVEPRHGRLVARAVGPAAGLIEARGIGLLSTAFEPSAVVGLAITLGRKGERWPEEASRITRISGVALPHLASDDPVGLASVIVWRERGLRDTVMTG